MAPKQTFEERIETAEHREASWMDAGHSVREQIHYICESPQTSDHQKEMAFLRHLLRYDPKDGHHELEGKITRAERNERCARRAVWLMVVVTALAVAGLGYAALLLEDFPPNSSQFVTRIFCALGLASLVSLAAFLAFWMISRGELNEQREACRRAVTRIVESRLGKPAAASWAVVRPKLSRSQALPEERRQANGASS